MPNRGSGTSTIAGPATLRWRAERLVRAGLSWELARRIAAEPAYDLHALLELIDRGCPPRLAVRILAPVEGPPGE